MESNSNDIVTPLWNNFFLSDRKYMQTLLSALILYLQNANDIKISVHMILNLGSENQLFTKTFSSFIECLEK